jgi:hypothetical protein
VPKQVPKHVTEVDLRPLFEPYGEIMCLNVLRTQRGQGPSAGCAFVEVLCCGFSCNHACHDLRQRFSPHSASYRTLPHHACSIVTATLPQCAPASSCQRWWLDHRV